MSKISVSQFLSFSVTCLLSATSLNAWQVKKDGTTQLNLDKSGNFTVSGYSKSKIEIRSPKYCDANGANCQQIQDVATKTFVQNPVNLNIPTCTGTNKALQFNGTSFSCTTIESGGGVSSCITSEMCYGLGEAKLFFPGKGELTLQSNGYYKAINGAYLSKHRTFWEDRVAKFGTWNQATKLYYDGGNSRRNFSQANSLCQNKGWRLPAFSETTVRTNNGVPSYNRYTWTSTVSYGNRYVWRGTSYSHSDWYDGGYYVRCVR